jgi:ABC-type sugar transport system ATPase subunit
MDASPMATSIGSEVPLLLAQGITKYYAHVCALNGANLQINHGEIHALMGDNGAGKSTFVKVLAGVISAQHGEIEMGGKKVAFHSPADARAAGVETVFQDLSLAGTLDSGVNVFLGRELLRPGILGRLGVVDRARMRHEAGVYLASLGINLPSARSAVEILSGGQRQAIAVARAVYWGSQLLIMDEPTAALGVQQTEMVLTVMERVRDEKGVSVLLISHNVPQVLRVANRVTVLHLGKTVMTCSTKGLATETLIGAMTGARAPSLGLGNREALP